MHLWLTPSQAKALIQQAQNAAPQETCGLISGVDGQALEIVPVSNIADEPSVNYYLDPSQQASALLRFHREGRDLLAIYHSHPAGEPIPSQKDIREAAYPNAIYLIIGLGGDEPRLGTWHIDNDVTPVDIYVGHTRPIVPDSAELTPTQRTLVALTLVIAFIAVIAISLYLLPPAPPIPTPGG